MMLLLLLLRLLSLLFLLLLLPHAECKVIVASKKSICLCVCPLETTLYEWVESHPVVFLCVPLYIIASPSVVTADYSHRFVSYGRSVCLSLLDTMLQVWVWSPFCLLVSALVYSCVSLNRCCRVWSHRIVSCKKYTSLHMSPWSDVVWMSRKSQLCLSVYAFWYIPASTWIELPTAVFVSSPIEKYMPLWMSPCNDAGWMNGKSPICLLMSSFVCHCASLNRCWRIWSHRFVSYKRICLCICLCMSLRLLELMPPIIKSSLSFL